MSGAASMPVLRLIFVLLSAPVVIFSVHLFLARLRRSASRPLVAVEAIAASAVPMAIASWHLALRFFPPGEGVQAVIYTIVVYGCLANAYFHFFNMSESARRIRILYEVYKAGSLSPAAFESLYKTTGIISIRLRRLLELKQLRQEGGQYMVGGRTLLMAARVVIMWRRMLGLETRSK